jgi:hypothetical protein
MKQINSHTEETTKMKTYTFLNLTRGGWIAIHKAGCQDIHKAVRRGDVNKQWNEQAESLEDVVADFLKGNDFDNVTVEDFTVFSCAKETK